MSSKTHGFLVDLHDIVQSGHPAVLVSLDISAAFDSISHKILLERLESHFGVFVMALHCFTSYFTGRTMSVEVGDEFLQLCFALGISPRFCSGTSPVPSVWVSYCTSSCTICCPSPRVCRWSEYCQCIHVDSHSRIEQASSAICDLYLANRLLLKPQKSEVLVMGASTEIEGTSCGDGGRGGIGVQGGWHWYARRLWLLLASISTLALQCTSLWIQKQVRWITIYERLTNMSSS